MLLGAACTARAGEAPRYYRATERLADIPVLDLPAPRDAKRECRLSQVVRARFGAYPVIACGRFDEDASGSRQDDARLCLDRAIRERTPFLYETRPDGIDVTLGEAMFGVIEHGEQVLYRAHYVSNRAGAMCDEPICKSAGFTTIERCAAFDRVITSPESCAREAADCFQCLSPEVVHACEGWP